MKYRIYIDEVGNPDLESLDDPNHRSLSLNEPVIFHRKEMINAKPPFEILRDSAIRKPFDQELLDLVASWEYTVISVCLDKKKHKETYRTWRYDAYH